LGAIAMAKLPGNGNLLAFVVAILIVAVVGAIVALPALRLTGIYLALSTAAFAVLVSKLVFNQRQTFQTGNIAVPVLDVPFVEIGSPRSRLILASVAFSILGLLVVAVRRSRLGRRFIALKDSPAAAATLGMNLTRTKVVAFAMSAGIGACAGALAGDKVSPQHYDFTQSLPVVLLAVVGGVGTVGGAFFGGILLGGNSILASVVPSLKNLAKVLPGTIGITLGRNPNGAALQTAESFRSLQNRWGLISFAGIGAVAIWALAAADVLSHWSFFVTGVVWFLAVTPNLAAIADSTHPARRASTIVYLVAGLVLCGAVDWGTALDVTGQRLIAVIILVAVIGLGAQRMIENEPRVHKDSPDVLGLDRSFTGDEIERAERELRVSI
ncbi:MAG: branched-chain amino acid ABC transporter permease, partial [Actinomycetota bacterium]|nr:branched-chain amino acid ABC transporter permease [Actinomycetota bacterium]